MGEEKKYNLIKVWRFVKGNQIRGRGLCFQPGAQKSQFNLWRTTFDFFYSEFWDGCGGGGGRSSALIQNALYWFLGPSKNIFISWNGPFKQGKLVSRKDEEYDLCCEHWGPRRRWRAGCRQSRGRWWPRGSSAGSTGSKDTVADSLFISKQMFTRISNTVCRVDAWCGLNLICYHL
jgi:hypothetical protein